MRTLVLSISALLVISSQSIVGKRFGGGGRIKTGGSSRGSGGFFSSGRNSGSSSPSHGSSGGWAKPANTPSHGSTGGWNTPAGNSPSHGNAGGWKKPNTPHSDLPSSNIGPGGYPVQKNVAPRLPAYSPTDPRRNSPPPSYNSIYGSPSGQNWGPPPPYSSRASYHGLSSGSYPHQSGFGYPGGQTYHSSSYNGMNLSPPTYNSNYGYPAGGSWGYQPQRSSSSVTSGLGGFLIGYQASSLVHSLSNPWGYGSYGYNNYRPRYYNRNKKNETETVANSTKTEEVICVSYTTLNGISTPSVNPNCSCEAISFLDNTGQQATQYRCTRPGEKKEEINQLYQNVTEYAAAFKSYLPPEEVPKGPQVFKLKALTEEGKRVEAFTQLEKLVNMGRFLAPLELVALPITDNSNVVQSS